MVEFAHDLFIVINDREVVDCIFIDFSKAFDLVPWDLLIAKLIGYKINMQVVNWINEHLCQRRQCVVLKG